MRSMLLSAMATALAIALPRPAQTQDLCDEALAQLQYQPLAVGFPADSADLPPREREKLKQSVPEYLQMKNLKLCIIAQADGQGDDKYNLELAERRAAAVAQALAEEGLPNSVILLDVGAAGNLSYHPLERRILVLEAMR
ncbi:MAG TPA: OmpA family protein [Kiloniellales bacterium]|nr:OmpA family protein [Kiloniellales bacterium]